MRANFVGLEELAGFSFNVYHCLRKGVEDRLEELLTGLPLSQPE